MSHIYNTPFVSCNEASTNSISVVSDLDMSHGDSLQGSARQMRSRAVDCEPPPSIAYGHPTNHSGVDRNGYTDRRQKHLFSAESLSGTKYTPSRDRSTDRTTTEFDSEESVLAGQDRRRYDVPREKSMSPHSKPRTGFCKVHGYVPASERSRSLLSSHPLKSSTIFPGVNGGRRVSIQPNFEDEEYGEDPDERYSYSYDCSEEYQSKGRHQIYHRHVQNHHSHGDQLDQRWHAQTPKNRQQLDPSLDYSYHLPNTSLRKAKSVQVIPVGKNRNTRDTRKHRSSEWESEYDRGP